MNNEITEPPTQVEISKPEPSPSKSPQDLRTLEVSEALLPAYQKAATCEMTDEEIAALTAPFPDSAVEIRPHDGLIYIPHIFISNRLNQVFKPGKWTLIRRRDWFDAPSNTMFAEYVLLIRGCFIGESIGGHPFVQNNPKQNLSDVMESTAAEALRRIAAKRLSCGSQVWEPEYSRQWVSKYAVRLNNGKWDRRMGESAPNLAQDKPKAPEPPKAPPAAPRPATEATRKWMLDNISQIPMVKEYAIAKGHIANGALESWKLECVPTSKLALAELIRDVETFAATNQKPVPANPSAVMPENIAKAIITVPRAGQKRADYMTNPDTIGSLYSAVKAGDGQARARLFGLAGEWNPQDWVDSNGVKHPPSENDMATRAALDAFVEWHKTKDSTTYQED